MLFYLRKDVCRWLDQCVDTCGRAETLETAIPAQSFAQLVIDQTPPEAEEKLRDWGVIGYSRIFSRSIGIFNQFRGPPDASMLQREYLRYYCRYADFGYAAWRELNRALQLEAAHFPFPLYTSDEYTRMLEEQWKEA